jgi:hypothetical protein
LGKEGADLPAAFDREREEGIGREGAGMREGETERAHASLTSHDVEFS